MPGWAEYDAAYHLLTTPIIASRASSFIGNRDFDWYGLFEVSRPWSRSERILVQAAFDLWSGGRELEGRRNVALYDPIHTLDARNFAGLIEAVMIRDGLVTNAEQLNRVHDLFRDLSAVRDRFGHPWSDADEEPLVSN
jgi:hypothetical protein